MKYVAKMLTVVAICALTVGVADAQGRRGGAGGAGGAGGGQRGQGGRGGGMFGGTGIVQLVQNAAVLEDIKATDEQKTKLKDWATEEGPKVQMKINEKLMDVPMEERPGKRQAIVAEIDKDLWKAIDGVLKAEQTTRVKQVYVQSMTVRAFTYPDVADKLKLSDEQKGKIKTITEEYTTKTGEIMRAGRGGEDEEEFITFQAQGRGQRGGAGGGQGRGGLPPEVQKKVDDLTKETMTKIKEVLTADQKKSYDEMTGKEFDLAKLRPAPRGQ